MKVYIISNRTGVVPNRTLFRKLVHYSLVLISVIGEPHIEMIVACLAKSMSAETVFLNRIEHLIEASIAEPAPFACYLSRGAPLIPRDTHPDTHA